MNRNKLLSILLSTALLTAIVAVPASAAADIQSATVTQPGAFTTKDEVVYARLDSSGAVKGLYVVNIVDVTQAGTIADYGSYHTVNNLTDLSPIKQMDDQILIEAPVGRYYYQGNIQEATLPWAFTVGYQLDGAPVAPEDLGGRAGTLVLTLNASPQAGVNPVFFENYLLQISLTMPGAHCKNLSAPNGTIANVGENQMITFTTMPGEEGKFTVQCDVTDFIFGGINVAAVPFQMSIELPDTTQFSTQLGQLSDGISALRSGVAELSGGVTSLGKGVSSLAQGSSEYQAGVNALSGQSAQLTMASQSILDALNGMNAALSGGENLSPAALAQLPAGLTQLSGGLKQVAGGLSKLTQNYTTLLATLDQIIDAIPSHQISPAELQALGQNASGDPALQKLTEVYTAAMTAKATYQQLRTGLRTIEAGMGELGGSVTTVATVLDETATQITAALSSSGLDASMAQLRTGLDALAQNYGGFHQGLTQYAGGVVALSSGYSGIHGGISDLKGGVSKLDGGSTQLLSGANQLADETSDMPQQMADELQGLTAGYDTSDFIPTSFISDKNQSIGSVTFVLKLDGIERPIPPVPPVEATTPQTFWDRLLSLFNVH